MATIFSVLLGIVGLVGYRKAKFCRIFGKFFRFQVFRFVQTSGVLFASRLDWSWGCPDCVGGHSVALSGAVGLDGLDCIWTGVLSELRKRDVFNGSGERWGHC